jgi:hypothetical protein
MEESLLLLDLGWESLEILQDRQQRAVRLDRAPEYLNLVLIRNYPLNHSSLAVEHVQRLIQIKRQRTPSERFNSSTPQKGHIKFLFSNTVES